MTIQKTFILCVLALATLQASAVPAKRAIRQVRQSDGTTLSLVLRGDENFHYLSTTDGLPVTANADGSYSYGTVSGGRLMATGVLAHNVDARTADELSFLETDGAALRQTVSKLWTQRLNIRNRQREAAVKNRLRAPQRIGTAGATTGEKRGLVILVNFSDKSMQSDAATNFYNQFNQEGYNKNRHIGSVRDYFRDQSYGQLTIDFDVVGPYTVSRSLSYYGSNDSYGSDKYAGAMVAEACRLADDDVDYSDYDWDGDGSVDQVYVIYAGYGEASGAASNTIWPHEWQLSYSDYGRSLTLDGVTIDTYACSNELTGTSGTVMDGIGTACHEFSHCLGLPDLYDTEGDNFGMCVWSVMDYGCYGGPSGYEGSVPCAYTSYERMYSGWLTPTTLSDGRYVNGMRPITDADAQEAYIIYNEANANEYYMLENRQLTSWDTYQYGHGMLVIHVDYSESVWENNEVNNTASRQRCTIIPADNAAVVSVSSLAGDPYPGTKKNTALTNTSSPAATLYNANADGTKYLSKPITDITESTDGLISFTFNGGDPVDTPVANDATDIILGGTDGNSFTASWSAIGNAVSYTLEVREVSDQAADAVLTEDFVADFTGQSTNAGTDWSSRLDEICSNAGWTGEKVFNGTSSGTIHGAKLGSGSKSGYLLSPTVSAPSSGIVTVYVNTEAYNSTNALQLTVTVLSSDGSTLGTYVCSQTGEYAFSVSDVTTGYQVNFATDTDHKRAFIGSVAFYDGEISLEDIQYLNGTDAPRRLQQQTIADITSTSYTVTGLTGNQYTYRVKAISSTNESDWSNRVSVVFAADAITATEAGNGNGLTDIYSLNGQLLRRTVDGSLPADLPAGIYILHSGRSVRKVMK